MNLSMKNSATTAILLFAQSEESESAAKPIVSNKKQNVLLWKRMNEKVLRTVQKTNLPYFISDENSQVGSTFGEKITHAISDLFAKGFQKVIVIGNDCLELESRYMLAADHKLQYSDLVLGADNRGGAYLIGVSKSAFNAEDFSAIAWQTSSVFETLQAVFSEQKIALLPCLNDCNNTFDFKKAVQKLSFSDSFTNEILSLLQHKSTINYKEISIVSYEGLTLNFNKGSPISSLKFI